MTEDEVAKEVKVEAEKRKSVPKLKKLSEVERTILHDEKKLQEIHADYRQRMQSTPPEDMRLEVGNAVIEMLDALRNYTDTRYTLLNEEVRSKLENSPYVRHEERKQLYEILEIICNDIQRIYDDVKTPNRQIAAMTATIDEFYPKPLGEKLKDLGKGGVMLMPDGVTRILTFNTRKKLMRDKHKVT